LKREKERTGGLFLRLFIGYWFRLGGNNSGISGLYRKIKGTRDWAEEEEAIPCLVTNQAF